LVNGLTARKRDGIAISEEDSITLKAKSEAELLVIEVLGLTSVR